MYQPTAFSKPSCIYGVSAHARALAAASDVAKPNIEIKMETAKEKSINLLNWESDTSEVNRKLLSEIEGRVIRAKT